MSFTSDSWKKTGGINRTSSHNLVRIPKAIEGSLKVYENTNSSNITIDGNSKLQINQGYDINGKWGTEYGTYKIGEDVSSNIYDPHMLLYMATDPTIKNDYAYFMSESANGNTDRGNLTLVVGDNSDAHNDKFIIRGYDQASKKNTDIAVANVVGSNIFNLLWVLGLSAVISPMKYETVINADVVVLLAATCLILFSLMTGRAKNQIGKPTGVVFLISYVAYMAFLVYRG